uniref:Peptidase S1 domain-containing protein n=1 Tax=Anopheles epiroticus TaxID=199890 RepID=A0A182PE76_9DIPT
MPNVRESLDDCHMRYYKHSVAESSYPIYERPHLAFNEYPHLALIGWTDANGAVRWDCIGTLVWENFILTSARCTANENSIMPDVVSLGNSGETQQLKIRAVQRRSENEGVALLHLESKVDSTVVPACLWHQDMDFHVLDAVGWSSSNSSDLTGSKVHPVQGGCNNGQNSDKCVESSETDSCVSGGFLQVDMQHNSKVSPFVVAIDSTVNGTCMQSGPVRYTTVAPHVQWISSTIEASGEPAWEWKFREAECALRYVHLRQYEKDVVIAQTDTFDTVSLARRGIEPRYTDAMVEISFGGYGHQEECYGLIIDEETVLTLAQCTTRHGKRATFVTYRGNERNTVVKHYNHPGYREGQHQNNIGLLKLKMRLVFFGSFVPFCIWHDAQLPDGPLELTGHGRRDLNYFSFHNASVDVFEPQDFQLIARSTVLEPENCSNLQNFSVNLAKEHLCLGSEPYIVPQTCQQAFGGPIGGKEYRFQKLFRYAYALNYYGRDCGFGRAAVGVRLSSHIDWLRSILLPDYRKDSGSLHFLHSELEKNDTCQHVDGTEGKCVEASRCPKIRYDFSANRQVVFCHSATIVCCPYGNMLNETAAAGREIDNCEERYQAVRERTRQQLFAVGPVRDKFPHLVLIGWQEDGRAIFSCRGTLITSKAVLTTAKCVQKHTNSPSFVRLGMEDDAPVVTVEETVVHPQFNSSSGKNDLAVVKLKDSIEQSTTEKYPACLWTNQTHTPFQMVQLLINTTTDTYVYPTAMYNADCNALVESLTAGELCVDVQPPNSVIEVGDPMFWSKVMDNGSRVQYLVGVMSHAVANDRSAKVHTRISSYVGWIKNCHYRYYKYGKNSLIKPAYGRPTYLREFAHMAAIGWTQEDNTIIWNCGGSLIWENYILTAAHCAEDSTNNAPDVARFADLDLYNDTDDQYAQQLKIVEIIRHPEHRFQARYHDIALMRLEHRVRLHDTVAPACLWTDDEIRFKTFEATGWGDTGFAAAKTPILLKVALSPVESERCNEHYLNLRGLRTGLHENQLCAGDARMDTCPGDSGGPLQVKLLHNTRVTPFIVGVTSFGMACGLSVPGVYTRVAPYAPWIKSVLKDRGENGTEWKLEPQACALRYVLYREFESRVVLQKRNDNEELDLSEGHLYPSTSRQLASIHWNETNDAEPKECFGVIIDESTIVTLARCAMKNGKPPSYVSYLKNETSAVSRSYIHPEWREGSLYGDVGLLKLRKALKFSSSFLPACIWERADIPDREFHVSGRGILELNEIYTLDWEPEPIAYFNNTTNVLGVVELHNGTNCTQYRDGTPAEHLCFGADPFVVPGTCQQSLGGPVEHEIERSGRSLMYVYALNLYGRDCGYGESAVGVRLSVHLPWMNSVLLPTPADEDPLDPFIFLNNDLEEGDICTLGESGTVGVCTGAMSCPKMLYRFRQNLPVRFCGSGSVLCCPREDVRSDVDAEWREIDRCGKKSNGTEEGFDPHRHTVYLEWTVGEGTRSCIGTMITSRTFVTAASCLDGDVTLEYVTLNNREVAMTVMMVIEQVVVHPEYDSVTKRHNIALVRTLNRTEAWFGKTPACLWSNKTHTPFYLQQVGITETATIGLATAFTKFNSDCDRTFGKALTPHELCVDMEYSDYAEKVVVDEGTPALWPERGTEHYLVGIASHVAPNDSSVFLHTRIEAYVGWIKNCHLRYYSFGGSGAVAPAAGRPAYLRDNDPPDVVRFGDLNLYNDTDDQFAQQYRIVEIIRHPEHRFSAKYHDIALIRLEKSVTLNETVAPACLWSDEELRFNVLEAAGWGATGFGQSQTPVLLKVSLKPVERNRCDQFYRAGDRGLRDGLQDYQLCAGDVKMDTCPGDSGGPLQVKLLHNAKVTPFVVAVTSFGSACGQSTPGVYTKVSKYVPWIRIFLKTVFCLDWKFRPYACALRYVQLREYEPDVVSRKLDGRESLSFDGVHVTIEDSLSTVKLGWEDARLSAPDNCYGVLIDEDTVLTLAECTNPASKSPTHVIVLEDIWKDIARIYKHPDYRPGSPYSNIAIIKLKEPIFFSSRYFMPACPWLYPELPGDELEVTGRGRSDLNTVPLYDEQVIGLDASNASLLVRSNVQRGENCSLSKEHRMLFTKDLPGEHLCFGHETFFVPASCEQLFGGAIQRNLFRYSKYFKHVYALNLLGRDCGFGQSAVGVRLASYAEWMSKVLVPARRHEAAPVHFYNTDLELDDHCKRSDGSMGLCVDVERCPKVRYDLEVQRQVTFCGNGTIVCCPYHKVLNGTAGAGIELDECEARYSELHKNGIFEPYWNESIEERFSHVVMIAWQSSDGEFDFCIGTLITKRMALSSGNCLSRIGNNRAVVKLGWDKTAPTLWVKETVLHPRYEESTLRNDIGLVKIDGEVDPKTGKVPACIWQNQTHTPFHMRQFMLSDLKYLNSYPKYNKDCEAFEHFGNRSLEATQLCADLELEYQVIETGEPSFWQKQLGEGKGVVHYLVGIVSYVFPAMTVQTRVESYVDWIKTYL